LCTGERGTKRAIVDHVPQLQSVVVATNDHRPPVLPERHALARVRVPELARVCLVPHTNRVVLRTRRNERTAVRAKSQAIHRCRMTSERIAKLLAGGRIPQPNRGV
jgi:hypothetical protein